MINRLSEISWIHSGFFWYGRLPAKKMSGGMAYCPGSLKDTAKRLRAEIVWMVWMIKAVRQGLILIRRPICFFPSYCLTKRRGGKNE